MICWGEEEKVDGNHYLMGRGRERNEVTDIDENHC